MAARTEIVVAVDGRSTVRGGPTVRADDPMFARGDGVFETLLVRDGRVRQLEAHLARLARSAAIVGLPTPDPTHWRVAVAAAGGRWPDAGEAVLRLVLGRERSGGATGFVTVSALPARVVTARRDGVSAMTLDRGVTVDGDAGVPWSLAGAKSLSYALNAAALRHAERVGADDVILVSTDGYVLEGPRSNVVIADADGMLATPPATLPILPGTTVAALFDVARARGRLCTSRPLRIADLLVAQGVWLLSSITLAARIHTLNGCVLPAASTSVAIMALIDEAIEGGS